LPVLRQQYLFTFLAFSRWLLAKNVKESASKNVETIKVPPGAGRAIRDGGNRP
jgi:hypothetical protein